jgi:MFS family permease
MSKSKNSSSSTKDHFFRNVYLNFGDAVFMETVNGMTPIGTVIASLLRYLTPSKTLIASLGALNSLVQGVPQVLAACRIESAPLLKPVLLSKALRQRLIWFILAGLVFWLIPSHPDWFIPAFIAGYCVYGYYTGYVSLVWIGYMVKLVPAGNLGRFLGFRAAIGSAAAIGGALLSKGWLERYPFPYNYGLIFILAGVLGLLSVFFLAATREKPAAAVACRTEVDGFWNRARKIIGSDRNFQYYLLATIFVVMGKMAFPLQVVYAQETLGIGVGQIALASAALMGGQTVGYVFWGWLVDRSSFKTAVILSTFSFIPSLLLTYWMFNEWMLYGAVAIFSFSQSARNFCENGLVMEISGEAERSIYMGLRNGLLAPFFAVSNVLGGVFTDWLGYEAVVLAGIPLMIIGGILNWTQVKADYQTPKLTTG